MTRNTKLAGASAAAIATLAAISYGGYETVNDDGAGTRAAPVGACGSSVCPGDSWQTKLAAAEPGEVLTVAAGDYGNQLLTGTKAPPGVTFSAQAGVTMRTLTIRNGAAGINVEGVKAKVVFVFDSQRVRLSRMDVGECRSDATINCSSKISNSTDVTVTQSSFHDVSTSDAVLYHIECLFIANGTNRVRIERTRFFRCEVFDIFIQTYSAGFPNTTNLTLENNWFDAPLKGDGGRRNTAVTFSSTEKGPYTGTTIAYNSFSSDAAVNGAAGIRFVGNLYQGHNCLSGATYSHNVIVPFSAFNGNTACSSDGKVTTGFGYVSSTDFNLTETSAAIGAGNPNEFPPVDYNGDTRTSPPDSGSVEYAADPPPPPTDTEPEPAVCQDKGSSLALTKTAEDATSVTFSWTPPANAAGYRYSRTGYPKRPHTWNGTTSSARFAKGSDCYYVETLLIGASGGAR